MGNWSVNEFLARQKIKNISLTAFVWKKLKVYRVKVSHKIHHGGSYLNTM